jgi:hypothetical protein
MVPSDESDVRDIGSVNNQRLIIEGLNVYQYIIQKCIGYSDTERNKNEEQNR